MKRGRDPRRRVQRGVDAGARCSTASRRIPAARSTRSWSATTTARTARTWSASATSSRRPTCRSGRAPPAQPRLRRQPEGRLPVGDRARARHRRAAARRRPVRARAARRDGRAARARRGRRGVRLADDASRARPGGAGCRCYKSSATGSSPTFENAVVGHDALRVALGLPRLLASRRSREHPVRAQHRRLRLRHRDHHAAASRPGSASSRSRSRPTTATRSATSTGCKYAKDVTVDVVALPAPQDGLRRPASWRSRATAYELKDGDDIVARQIARVAGAGGRRPGARPRLLRRPTRRAAARPRATT